MKLVLLYGGGRLVSEAGAVYGGWGYLVSEAGVAVWGGGGLGSK